MSTTEKKLLTVRDAAARLGVSQALVYLLVAGRKIRHQRHGMKRGAIRIPLDALEEYEARCTVDTEDTRASAHPQARPPVTILEDGYSFLPPPS